MKDSNLKNQRICDHWIIYSQFVTQVRDSSISSTPYKKTNDLVDTGFLREIEV